MMQENVYVRTVALHKGNYISLAEDIRKWLIAPVYVQNEPLRLVIVCNEYCTVINEGDVFSFMLKAKGNKHSIVNHSEKRNTVKVKVGSNLFVIETFVYETVGSTENCKFRLTCITEPDLSGEFDDYEGVQNRLNEFLKEAVYNEVMQI